MSRFCSYPYPLPAAVFPLEPGHLGAVARNQETVTARETGETVERRKPVLLAHRGSPLAGVPENSRAAFDACIHSGEARGLETDVHATCDGYPVISHDPQWHAADGDVVIADVTWAELCRHRLPNGEDPLGFEEFLDRYPGIYVNIDFKVAAVLPEALRILEGRRDLERMGLASFSAGRVWEIAARLGHEPGYLPGSADVARFLLACESGVLFSGLRQCRGVVPRLLREYSCAFAVPERLWGVTVLTRRFIAGAHVLGCPVYVWTVNETSQFQRLARLGVDGVYTDFVHTLHQLQTI